jgi:hypothetical protein
MPTEIQITVDSYRLWLRAQRPPFEWFAALTAAEQSALAEAGEDERARANLELAYMNRDPEAAEAILTGDEVAAEQVAVERLARGALEAALGRAHTPYHHTEPITMAGALQRQQTTTASGPTLFGKAAD